MPRTTTIWTFVITSVALFMATLDNLVVTTSLPVIRDRLTHEQWTPAQLMNEVARLRRLVALLLEGHKLLEPK